MDKPTYYTETELADALIAITKPRPRYCPGFKLKFYSLVKCSPKPYIHFDVFTKRPIALLCDHSNCVEGSEVIFMLISLFASGVISDDVWLQLFSYRWRSGPQHHAVPRATTRPNESFCPGYKLTQMQSTGPLSESCLQFSRDIDPDILRPYTEICVHNECQPFAPFCYALYSTYARGLIEDLRPYVNSKCPKHLIDNFGWTMVLNKSTNYREMFTSYSPANSLNPMLSYLLFDTSCLVKSIPIQRFEPEIMLPDFKICATDEKRRVLIDEMSETSSSDDDDDGHFNDFFVYNKQAMSDKDNSLTARMAFGNDPTIYLENAAPFNSHASKTHIESISPSHKEEHLSFNVKQNVPGLIQFLCKSVTETEDKVLIEKTSRVLRHGIELISSPDLVYACRRRNARLLRKKWRSELFKK